MRRTLSTALVVVLMVLLSVPVNGAQPVTLTFWHYFTDRAPLLEELAKAYEAKTGVRIELQLLQGDVLAQKFQAAAQSGTAPDVCAAWAGPNDRMAELAKEGNVLNLQPYMDQGWGKRFEPAMLEACSFQKDNKWGLKPGVYFVVIDCNNMQIVYNTDAYQKAGLKPPETFEEWLGQAKALKAAGYAPFSAGFGAWALPAFCHIYIWNVVGPKAMEETYLGKMPFTAEPWLKFLNLFVKLRDSGLLADGAVTFDVPASESLFANERAAALFDGSWVIGVLKSMNPGFGDFDVFMPPPSVDGKYPVKIPGGIGALLFANGNSKHKEEAVEFLMWLTDVEAQTKYATSSLNLPAVKTAADPTRLSPVLAHFAAHMRDIQPSLKATMPPVVEAEMTRALQDLLIGRATPAQVAARMEQARPKQ